MTTQQAVLRALPLINAKRQYGGMRIVIDNVSVDDSEVRNTLALMAETDAAAQNPLIVAFECKRLPASLHRWEPPANTYPEFHGEWLSLPVARDILSNGKYPLWCLAGATGAPLDPALSKSLVYTVANAASENSFGTSSSLPAGKSRIHTGAVSYTHLTLPTNREV